ncbi:MAG: DEAD/DEAH box helicase [Flavobacteriaceae bacterium]|nr:DEAD/DEAH box helicase [Flavobacteriaceae bacterium]
MTDDTGLGKTVQAIAACDAYLNKNPNIKIIVVTLASTQLQWEGEFRDFLPDYDIRAVVGTKKQRLSIYNLLAQDKINGVILNYDQLYRDMLVKKGQKEYFEGPFLEAFNKKQYVLFVDEIQKCKSPGAKRSKCVKYLSKYSDGGTKGLTATPFFNRLIDIYGIFKILEPKLFTNKEAFKKMFCILNYAFNQWGTIVGYKNHGILRRKIEPFTFGRKKDQVKRDLPPLIPKPMFIQLPTQHKKIYDSLRKKTQELEDEDQIKGALVREQVCVNNLEALKGDVKYKPSHPKLDEAIRLIDEELDGQRIIVFSKFKTTIDIFQKMLNNSGIRNFRITGSENQNQRQSNQKQWESEEGTSVLLITTAGGAGLNLQAASTLVMIDRPWSLGELDQIKGRIRRIGSTHTSLLMINLIVEDSIDEIVLASILNKRKDVKKVTDKQCQLLKKLETK